MIWDMHCDVLSKLLMDEAVSFRSGPGLDATLERLQAGGVGLQAFAVFIPETWRGKRYDAVLESVDRFRRRVLPANGMRPVRWKEDLARLDAASIGALLTLEGADGLEGNPTYLRIAHALGVRALGITWNHANWAADGVGEPRGGGLTSAGWDLVRECERLKIILDVSHLSERAFWQLAEGGTRPFIASHSNVRSLCDHPRNLTEDQVRAVLAKGGRIGVTFVPFFLRDDGQPATIDDVLRHVERICELGGERHVGFGSDFDGVDEHVAGLEHPGCYGRLREALLKRYSEELTERFLWRNWFDFFRDHLPSEGEANPV